jgi:class 3 adenylate cyclase
MSEPARSAVTTILFTDLVNSTDLLGRIGDERGQRVFEAFHERMSDILASHGGDELQWFGDGLMAAFPSPADAVRCAIAMQQAVREPIEDVGLEMRAGLNVGEVLQQDSGSGHFGTPVVIAARLCALGRAGDILASSVVTGLLAGRQGFQFRERGRQQLKGIAAPLDVVEVAYEGQDIVRAAPAHTRENADQPDAARLPAWVRLGALAAFAALTAVLVLRGFTFDPILAQAAEVAEQGVRAAQAGNALDAKRKLQTAAGMLYRSGQLDGLEDAEALSVAMQRLEEALSEDVDLLALFRAVVEDARRAAPPAASAESTCRLDAVASDQLAGCLRSRIDEALVGFRQEPSAAPDDLHRLVGAILVKEHELIRRSLERGSYLVPMLREQLEAENMPPLLHYVALIESGYRASAVSHTGATGLWQFIPETARRYGLTVTEERDDRYDPADATRAAAHYLRDLALEFGGDSLFLAVASYNFGENGVRRALRQLDDPFNDRNYWELAARGLLPPETVDYVPRLLAATVAGEAGLPDVGALQGAGY